MRLASSLLAAAAWLPLAASLAAGQPMTRRGSCRGGLASLVASAAADPRRQVDVDPRHAPLLSWLEKCGMELGPVSLGKSRIGDGYGAFATRDVAEGELLFSVPSSACSDHAASPRGPEASTPALGLSSRQRAGVQTWGYGRYSKKRTLVSTPCDLCLLHRWDLTRLSACCEGPTGAP